ncbi:MAG TPA: thiamine-phosphate kinase [Nitrososphaerales archaeon]|nr:thiamine-phosphate kinase [Nitrososphaerales archaeon]HUK75520.1 thiamine-phosphate kinase [Nitrososphaerales archaeon]
MLDEYGVISLITKGFGDLPQGYLPIGDDVALIPPGRQAEGVVLKCDMLVGRTDVPPTMSWRQAARKAVAMCVSDFAAKGVRPSAFMVSLGLRRGTPERRVAELAAGLRDASREWGVRLVGGDTGEADDLIIDCLMVGFAERVVRRSGARPGEFVVTTGTFGQTAAGLKILMEGAKSGEGFRKVAVSSVYTPKPRLRVGMAIARYLSSSIDSSDGLSISLHTICEMSGVGIRLTETPFVPGLAEFASKNSLSMEDLALYGGEEYEIVGTVGKNRIQEARKAAREEGGEIRIIGETVTQAELRGVAFPDGRRVRRKGWVHFRSRP